MHLRPEFEADLRKRIREHGLESAEDVIFAHSAESIRIHSVGRDDGATLGASRFGGDPDLPRDWCWPTHRRMGDSELGRSNFVCQVNFAELPMVAGREALPASGLLYVSVEAMEAASDPVLVDALYHEGPEEELARRPSPPSELLLDEYLVGLQPTRVTYSPGYDCESNGYALQREIEERCGHHRVDGSTPMDRYRQLCEEVPAGGDIGQLLGFGNAYDENLVRKVALTTLDLRGLQYSDYWGSMDAFEASIRRFPDLRESYESKREDVEWLLANAPMIDEEVARWQHLLRINSNAAMGLCINDADPMYLFIRSTQLRAKRFIDVACEVTQG
jgi:hypothetical protein